MGILEIIFIGISLSMDAFAVSICKGLSVRKISMKKSLIISIYFGGFQALMPVIGYYLGITFSNFVTSIDHWIAFILLSVIGGNMIKDAFKEKSENQNDSIDFKTMTILAIATSIDALAIGITFAFLKVNIYTSSIFIGLITFFMSILGVNIGNKFGNKFQHQSEFIGGIILILIGTKILLEHLGIF